MACRVGMTTDPERRRKEWQARYPSLRHWSILASGLTRTEAQKREEDEAKKRGCTQSGGGDDPDKPKARSVYYFEYEAPSAPR